MRSPFRCPGIGSRDMERPTRFEHHRFLGDKRNQRVVRPRHLHRRGRDRRADGGRDLPLLRARHARRGPQPRLPASRRATPSPPTPSSQAPAVELRFPSGGNLLAAHLARPPMRADAVAAPAVVLAHGYPSDVSATAVAASALPELADRLAAEMGWLAMALAFRAAATRRAASRWPAGSTTSAPRSATCGTTSGSRACGWPASAPAARSPCARRPPTREVRGVATLGAPADFDDWASHPKRLLEHAREVGIINDPTFPADVDAWTRELRELRAVACAPKVAPASAPRHPRQRRRPRPRVRRPCPRRRPRRRRAAHHERRRPPRPPRPPRHRGPPRLARPVLVVVARLRRAPPSCRGGLRPAQLVGSGGAGPSRVGGSGGASAPHAPRRPPRRLLLLASSSLERLRLAVEPSDEPLADFVGEEGQVGDVDGDAEEADVEEEVDAEVEARRRCRAPRAAGGGSTPARRRWPRTRA